MYSKDCVFITMQGRDCVWMLAWDSTAVKPDVFAMGGAAKNTKGKAAVETKQQRA